MNSLYSLSPEAVVIATATTKDAVLEQIAALFAQVYDLDRARVLENLQLREDLGSTGFGRGVALPHARLAGLKRPVAAFIKLMSPVAYDSADHQPVAMAFGLLSPENAGTTHLHALAAVSRHLRDERTHEALMHSSDPDAIYALLSSDWDRDAA